jgi:gliding motility-associated-like protein
VGTHTVKLRVKDGTTNTDQIFDIEVININDAPVITSSEVTSAVEDAAYTYTFGASDVDAGSTLTYSAIVIPAWLSFNASTGVLSGTPTNAELGSHNIKLRVSDGAVDIDQIFDIAVTNANDDAVITSIAITSVNEEALYTYTFEATDVDAGDVLTYSAPVLPSWLTFDSSKGILSGTPDNADVGSHSVTLRVNDGSSDVDQQFTIEVSNTNDAPVITSTAITAVDEDTAYSYTITATDVDASDHSVFSATSIPSWLTFNVTTGILSGTPTNSDLGNHNVTLRVNDGTTDVDQTFTITVNNTNDAPVISSIPVTSVDEDADYTYTLVATDVDVQDVIIYSAPTLPSWMTFNTSTGILSGTPSNNDVGIHTVTLRVNDGSTDIEQTFTINISNTNDGPVVTSTALTSAEEDALYLYTFTATDVDPSDVLAYSVDPLPSWLSFNPATGALSGTPSNDDIGNHSITLHVSDGTVAVDQIFQLVVINANDAPVITSTPVVLIDEDALYTYTVAAADADLSDILTFTAPVLPSWLTFNSETGELSGTPANEAVGTHTVTLRVSDGNENIDQTFTVEVNNVNDAPVVTSPEVAEAKENSKYSYTIQAADADASSDLTYSTSTLPSWLTFNPETGVLEGTPTNADAGTHQVTVIVSDGVTSTEQVITIVVAPNIPPVVIGQTFSIDEKSAKGAFVGEILASDEDDGTTLTDWKIISGNDENAFSLDAATGNISVNNEQAIDFESRTSFTLVVTVSDGFTTSEPRGVIITINDVTEGLNFYAAFSPNNDNVNDTWEIDGLQDYPNSVLKIFNSDGIEMFHNVGYTSQWNGTFKGKEMPLGTYFYLINLNDGSGKKLNGHFMIIK